MKIRLNTMFGLSLCLALLATGCSGRRGENQAVGSHADLDSAEAFLVPASQVTAVKDSLIRAGAYECCAQPGCDYCVKKYRTCECYVRVKRSDPMCGECFEAYKKGEGKLKMVSIPELQRVRERKVAP